MHSTLQKSLDQEELFLSPFDEVAGSYQDIVNKGLSITGESLDYFARARLEFTKSCLPNKIERVLDFGCGPGNATQLLFDILGPKHIVGVDLSREALREAQEKKIANADFEWVKNFQGIGNFDFAYANTVFHHIPIADRKGSLKKIYDSLSPGGYFAFWENNPWNPGTRWVMSRIPFDHDAILLNVFEAGQLLRDSGFLIERTDFRFIFPRRLQFLRPTEKLVTKLPIGGQYQILAKKVA